MNLLRIHSIPTLSWFILTTADKRGRGGFLFSVDGEQAALLDNEEISDDLKNSFLVNEETLSETAYVAKVVDDLWRILDGDRRYLIRYNAEQDRLDVERARILIDSACNGYQPVLPEYRTRSNNRQRGSGLVQRRC